MLIFLCQNFFFNTHICTKHLGVENQTHHIDPSGIWEFWRFNGILHKNWQCWSNIIKIPRSDTSQIFTSELYFFSLSSCHGACPFSALLSHSSPSFAPHKPSSFCVLCVCVGGGGGGEGERALNIRGFFLLRLFFIENINGRLYNIQKQNSKMCFCGMKIIKLCHSGLVVYQITTIPSWHNFHITETHFTILYIFCELVITRSFLISPNDSKIVENDVRSKTCIFWIYIITGGHQQNYREIA